jgi:hypothetical protein
MLLMLQLCVYIHTQRAHLKVKCLSCNELQDLAASQLKRKLAQTGSLEALVNSLPTTKASNNPPSEVTNS